MLSQKIMSKASMASFDFIPKLSGKREYVVAGFLTALWSSAMLTYGAGYFGLFSDSVAQEKDFIEVVVYFCAFFMPVLFVWLGAFMIIQTRQLQSDARQLQSSIETLQSAINVASPASSNDVANAIAEATSSAIRAEQSRVTTQFRNLADQQTKIEQAVKTLLKARGQEHEAITELVATAQDVAQKAVRKASVVEKRNSKLSKMTFDAIHEVDGQETLPFDAPDNPTVEEFEWIDLVRALNFPEDEKDLEGFAAIRKVLPNRKVAQLLQSSEDVLSMLAQEGIYMDDLTTSEANPDVWHKFARGARGADIADMGTIADQAAIALAKGRARSDHIFKDASLHFMRLFDKFLQEFIDQATDRDIKLLAETRTGRAFQLMARVSGTFD